MGELRILINHTGMGYQEKVSRLQQQGICHDGLGTVQHGCQAAFPAEEGGELRVPGIVSVIDLLQGVEQ